MIFIDSKSFRLPQIAQKWSQIDVNDRNLDDFSLNSRYFANQRDVNPEIFRKYLFHHKSHGNNFFRTFTLPGADAPYPLILAPPESTYS